MSDTTRDLALALGAHELARREAVERELRRVFTERTNAVLAPAGYRLANGAERGAAFRWLRIDDREMDGGLCKVWVVALNAAEGTVATGGSS